MSEQWSSYDDQQQRVEDWRTFLKEGSFLQRMRKKDTPDIEDMSDPEVLEIYATATDEKIVRQAARQYLRRAIDATDSNARIQTLNDIVTSKEAAPTSQTGTTALGEPAPPIPATPSRSSTRVPTATPVPVEDDEEEDEEEVETTEISEEECAEIFKVSTPEIQKLLDQAKADNTIRGKVAEIGRDLSMTADAATLALIAATAATVGGAAPGLVVTGAISWGGSAIAVAADILNGEFKQAALDSVGMLMVPGSAAVGKGAKATAKAGARSGAKTAGKAAAKAAETAIAKNASKLAGKTSGKMAQVEAKLIDKLKAAGLEEGVATPIAKGMMISAEKTLEAKMQKLLGDLPVRGKGSEEEYQQALRDYYKERRTKSQEIFNACLQGEESELTQGIKNFLDEVHDWVDDLPRWFDTVVGWIHSWGDDDEEEEAAIEDAEATADELYGGAGAYAMVREVKASNPPLIKEAQLKRWQQLAGINPRVL